MQVLVKKWGNSASVRIPVSVMEATRLNLDDPVDVREEGGRIIIEPIRTDAVLPDDNTDQGLSLRGRDRRQATGGGVV